MKLMATKRYEPEMSTSIDEHACRGTSVRPREHPAETTRITPTDAQLGDRL